MLNRYELNALYQYAFSLTAEPAAAEDLVQGALERYLRGKRRADSSVAYLRTIIRNMFIDDCRRKQRVAFESIEEHIPAMVDTRSMEKQLIDSDTISHIFAILGAAEREVLYLWAVLGYSASEISRELEQPRGTILSRLYRVRQKVMALDGEQTVSEGGGVS